MKIPTKFKMMGQEYTVKLDDPYDGNGIIVYNSNKIVIRPSGFGRPKEVVEHDFYHELFHLMLWWAGEEGIDPPLHKREFFVDRMAGLWREFLESQSGQATEMPPPGSWHEIPKP